MTDVAETFIEILKNARVALTEGLGKDIPAGDESDTREELTARADDIEEQIVEPLRGLVADLSDFIEELSTKCADVSTTVQEATDASDEYDAAVSEVQDFEGDEESDEFSDLQDEETRTENVMNDADEVLVGSRDDLLDAIATLVQHIGEAKSAEEVL